MSEKLVEFILGNGYYNYFDQSDFVDDCIDSLKACFSQLKYIDSIKYEVELDFVVPGVNTEEVIKVKNFLLKIVNYAVRNSDNPDFRSEFGIFIRNHYIYESNGDVNVEIMKLVPDFVEINSDYDDYCYIRITGSAYHTNKWYHNNYGEFDESIRDQMHFILHDDMKIPDSRLIVPVNVPYIHDTTPCMGTRNFLCKLPTPIELKANTKAFGEMVASLKDLYEYDFLKKCKEVFSIELTSDLLSGGSSMNILDQLPKIKRLERNGAFTTAVWEDGTVTKLKKSDQDEDDFEKLVFFLILKKLCDNNTHKMHETLTDYLNTFHDATVDIPKQKEEKAEKKRKAKEEAKGATKVILNEEWKEDDNG